MTKSTTLNLEERDYRRYYAIGDIHANMDDLSTLLALIREDGYDHRVDGLFFLGDYIDSYGPGEANEVVKSIRGLCEYSDVYAIRGNHEQLLIDAIDEKMSTVSFQIWWRQGGRNTYNSYQKGREDDTWGEYLDITKTMRSDIKWFKSLPTLVISPDYYFVHAGLDPIMAEATEDYDRIWIRERFLESNRDFGKPVIHGHTSRQEVEIKSNRINLDTSKYNRVNAVRLKPGREPLFFDKYGKYKVNEKGESIYVDHSSGLDF